MASKARRVGQARCRWAASSIPAVPPGEPDRRAADPGRTSGVFGSGGGHRLSHPEMTMDCLVIGGGPGGLTAAIYLARFLRDFLVVDAGASRAAWIRCSHNHAGYPDGGIPGPALLGRMRRQ